jgi:hypothetical protein
MNDGYRFNFVRYSYLISICCPALSCLEILKRYKQENELANQKMPIGKKIIWSTKHHTVQDTFFIETKENYSWTIQLNSLKFSNGFRIFMDLAVFGKTTSYDSPLPY